MSDFKKEVEKIIDHDWNCSLRDVGIRDCDCYRKDRLDKLSALHEKAVEEAYWEEKQRIFRALRKVLESKTSPGLINAILEDLDNEL